MQKGNTNQGKVNVTLSCANEQSLKGASSAPNPPATEKAVPLSLAARARWFVLGLVGGIFAMIIKLALPTKMAFEQRKQSEWAVWAGFAVNTFVLVVLINTGCIDAAIAALTGAGAAPVPAHVSPAFG